MIKRKVNALCVTGIQINSYKPFTPTIAILVLIPLVTFQLPMANGPLTPPHSVVSQFPCYGLCINF